MGYLHVDNLYKNQDILLFRECYAMEKIHGTSAHLSFKMKVVPDSTSPTDCTTTGADVHYFSGGTKHELFVSLFDETKLVETFKSMGILDREVVIFGESYGGKEQGMSHTYGKEPKFIVFDLKIGEAWLDVPKAEKVAHDFGLEFVPYHKVSTDIAVLDMWRDAPSEIAIRNGISTLLPENTLVDSEYPVVYSDALKGTVVNPRKREGVVLRPLIELRKNNSERVICKHKGDDFKETKTPRPVVDPSKLKVLEDAQAVAEEWVTMGRLKNILSHWSSEEIKMENTGKLIGIMIEDIHREASYEVNFTKEADKAIGKKTALLFKDYFKSSFCQNHG